ncbi:MAG: DUF3565 domain-containing protein [Deinococcus sp.]|nr:DUF3565 domain-containing protein [Deinococcus sp.]MCL5964476.1 DUF3565 domain-containing protein [Deinococcus sp.]
MKRRIVNYQRDGEGHWVAKLECGHTQHIRHLPPFWNRPWVETLEGRAGMLGQELDCKACDTANT